MDKIFGEIDYVEAGERETNAEKIEIQAIGEEAVRSHSAGDMKHDVSVHEESTVQRIDKV